MEVALVHPQSYEGGMLGCDDRGHGKCSFRMSLQKHLPENGVRVAIIATRIPMASLIDGRAMRRHGPHNVPDVFCRWWAGPAATVRPWFSRQENNATPSWPI
jgi:hypothetical protein